MTRMIRDQLVATIYWTVRICCHDMLDDDTESACSRLAYELEALSGYA